MHATDDQLVRRALGQPVPELDRHAAGCADCAAELAALSTTVATARAEGDTVLAPAPEAVWRRISAELALAEPHPEPVARRRLPTRWLAAAAAVAALAVVPVGRLTGGAEPVAALQPVAATGSVAPVAPEAGGSVRLAGDALELRTEGLPAPDGYYEVWLLDPGSGRMVALGALGADGAADLALPPGVAVADYPAVDVSVEPDDGDPAHSGVSALRAPTPA